MRLDKLLADCKYGTRTDVKKIIRSGSVLINGVSASDPSVHVTKDDLVTVNGTPVSHRENLYYIVDKPDNMLTAMEDKRLPTVSDLIPENIKTRGLSPVGRLDYHTTGLLILTNDGELSHRITSPVYDLEKRYAVTYEGAELTDDNVREAKKGITLTDTDTPVKLKGCELILTDKNTCELVLREGKTHEVRRIISYFGRSVITLRRVSVGPLVLTEEKPGMIREMTPEEERAIKTSVGL